MQLIQDLYQLPSDTYTQPLLFADAKGAVRENIKAAHNITAFRRNFSIWACYRSDSWLSSLRRDSCVDLIHKRHAEQQNP